MKKLLLFLVLLTAQFINAQAPTTLWQKCYGGSNNEGIGGGFQTSDGGYIVASYTLSGDGIVTGNHGGEDIWIIKTNSVGAVQWQKCYGGTGEEDPYSFIQTADGGYIICGKTNSNDGDVSGNHGGYDAWILKIDAQGTILWQKCFGDSAGDDAFYRIIATADGGYAAVGYAYTIGSWFVKLTNVGDVQWQRYYQYTYCENLIQTSDGGYVLSGGTTSSTFADYHGQQDLLLTKVNQGGNLQWQKCYGGSQTEYGSNVIVTNDGGYMITAESYSNDGDVFGNHGGSDIWVFKISNTGVVLAQDCYGGTGNEGGIAQQTLDGGYLISGNTTSNDGDIIGNHGGRDAFALKFSTNNVIQWQKCIGGPGDEYGGFLQLADGTYIAAGSTYSNFGDVFGNLTNATSDAFVMKLTADTLSAGSLEVNPLNVYPNPIHDVLHIETDKTFTGSLLDVTGKIVMPITTNNTDVTSLAVGTYLLEIVSEGKRITKKIIKQ